MPTERIEEIAVAQPTGTVDRIRGIIFGVKILGRHSANNREYTPDCLAGAVSLYEGAKVNVDHAASGRQQVRSYRDQIGQLRNVRLAGGSLRGDLHLNLKHEVAEQVLYDAENAPDACGLSHVIDGKTRASRGKVVVEEITKVHSVDLVTAPATVSGLFESIDDNAHKQAIANRIAEEIGLPVFCIAKLHSLPYLDDEPAIRRHLVRIKEYLISEGALRATAPKPTAVDLGRLPGGAPVTAADYAQRWTDEPPKISRGEFMRELGRPLPNGNSRHTL